MDWIQVLGAEFALAPEDVHRLELCATELIGNILRRAGEAPGDARIELRARVNERTAALEVIDAGRAFNPIAPHPATPAAAADGARVDGSELRLVQQFADECSYARRAGKNVVKLVLKRRAPELEAATARAPRGPDRRKRASPPGVPLWRGDGTLVLADERHGVDRRIRGFISQFEVFRGAPYQLVEDAIAGCRIMRYADGEVLLRPGERSDTLTFVLSGRLRVHSDAPDSANFSTIGAGDFAGELSVIDGEPVSAYVVADSDCRVLLVDADTLFGRLLTVPEVSRRFMMTLSGRVRHTSVHIISHLRDEMEQERQSRDLELARGIQATLLPDEQALFPARLELDCAARTRVARAFGGGFCDAFFVDSTRLLMVTGAVRGQALPAALLIGRTLTILRREAARTSLSRAFERLNRVLFASNGAGLSVSLSCVLLDIETGALTYVDAGHGPPAIALGTGRFERLAATNGPAVAVVEDAIFAGGEGRLPPGSALLLHTVELTDARAVSGEPFRDARLLAALEGAQDRSATVLVAATIAAVDRFAGDVPPADDLSVLALRYRGPAPG
jgi:serine phosphatase RsbU (regulator of sigma subunit)/anti-sigma regulatory factor (Ser/Thr protein kinase)